MSVHRKKEGSRNQEKQHGLLETRQEGVSINSIKMTDVERPDHLN